LSDTGPPRAPCAFRYTFHRDHAEPGTCTVCGRALADMKTCPHAMAVQQYLEGARDGPQAEAQADR